MKSALYKLCLRAGWAPIGVVVFHAVIARTALREPLDFLMHFLGGAAMAFFLFSAIDSLPTVFGHPPPIAHYLCAFALACTVGLFWEFGELFSDVFFGTHIQHSLRETMSDLIADTVGTVASLCVLVLLRLSRAPSSR